MLGAELVEGIVVGLICTNAITSIDTCSHKREHTEVLRLVPDLVDGRSVLTGVKPLFVRHLRLRAIKRADIVKLEGVFERVLNILSCVLQVHRVSLVNLGHELSDIYSGEQHQLLDSRGDIFVTGAEEFLLG